MTHTKGKFKDGNTGWKVREYPKADFAFTGYEVIYSDDGECVAEFVGNESNAKLIAAAPEMKELLQKFSALNENHPDYRSFAGYILESRKILKSI